MSGMGSLVLTVAHSDDLRDRFEALAEVVEPGAEWSTGDRHVVDVHLVFGDMVPGLTGLACDVNCRDNPPHATWLSDPYITFSASGGFDETTGIDRLNALSTWVTSVAGPISVLQAGIASADGEVVLRPTESGWNVVNRF